jgi:hypothetical protein
MSTTAVIGLGILAWVLLAILVALFIARLIRLRDRQRPDRTDPAPGTPAVGESPDGAESVLAWRGWRLRSKTSPPASSSHHRSLDGE